MARVKFNDRLMLCREIEQLRHGLPVLPEADDHGVRYLMDRQATTDLKSLVAWRDRLRALEGAVSDGDPMLA